jgi:pimeloyl-ACP methyl ester carboxylesterase
LHEEFGVPVAGGTLRVCRWPGAGPVVLAAHGITANALSWARVGEALAGRVTLVAPDLRGRAGSRDVPGPYGMAAHADDLVAILDHLGVAGPVPLVGHSMGGFVAAVAGARHAARFSGVLLVDGGVALTVPAGEDIDAVLHAVIGPAMRRLAMTFASREEYVDFFRAHPALSRGFDGVVEGYVLRDLIGEAPELRSSCVLDAIRADATDTLLTAETVGAVHRLALPVRLLWAERGLLDEPHGLYDEDRLAGTGIDNGRVEGVNHYTIVMGTRGAKLIAETIVEMSTVDTSG